MVINIKLLYRLIIQRTNFINSFLSVVNGDSAQYSSVKLYKIVMNSFDLLDLNLSPILSSCVFSAINLEGDFYALFVEGSPILVETEFNRLTIR